MNREEAKLSGLKRYVSGIPCKNGHIGIRSVTRNSCIQCDEDNRKKYNKNNREKVLNTRKVWRESNKEKISQKAKLYREENLFFYKQREKMYRMKDKKIKGMTVKEYNAFYYKNNKKKIKEINNRRKRFRKKHDIKYKIQHLMRNRLYYALRLKCKKGSAVKLLGCSIEEFMSYFETLFKEGMSWANHGKWHIDHIKPLSSFDLEDAEQLEMACHYTNLQPLWAKDNILKGAKLTLHKS